MTPIIISGFFKVAARFIEFPVGISHFMNWIHDFFTLVMVFCFCVHSLLVLTPWERPNLKSMIGYGKGGDGYVPLDYAKEENPDWIRHLEAEGKVK